MAEVWRMTQAYSKTEMHNLPIEEKSLILFVPLPKTTTQFSIKAVSIWNTDLTVGASAQLCEKHLSIQGAHATMSLP